MKLILNSPHSPHVFLQLVWKYCLCEVLAVQNILNLVMPGKICTAKYARVHKVPYLGICLGMQVATIEYARHVAGLPGANSTEFDPSCKHPVIALITEWKDETSARTNKESQGRRLTPPPPGE